jgi:hypothetical protein
MTGMDEDEIAKANTAMFKFATLRSRHRHVSMGKTELTTLTVLGSDSTKLTSCCLACTLSHCGARGDRALSLLIDKMRPPLQQGWSTSLLSRPGLVLHMSPRKRASFSFSQHHLQISL